MGNSIRFRLWLAATISILVALAIAGAGLRYLFELHVERRVVGELTVALNELIGATTFASDRRLNAAVVTTLARASGSSDERHVSFTNQKLNGMEVTPDLSTETVDNRGDSSSGTARRRGER